MPDNKKIKNLRKEAERLLTDKEAFGNQLPINEEMARLLEELSIHQIELEMQNDELQKSQHELEVQKNKFIDLYENAPVAYITISPIGNIISQNRKATEIFGNENSNFRFISIFPFLDQDSKSDFRIMLKDAFLQKKEQRGEIRMKTADKEIVHTEMHMTVYHDEAFGQDLCRITITNIENVRKVYNRRLALSEEKYRELAENISEGIYLTENGYIKMVNTPACKLFGYEPEELIERKVWDLVKPEKQEEVMNLFVKKVKKMDGTPVEVECIRKDGSIFWAKISMRIIRDQKRVFGVISDVTKQRETEQTLREINATKDKLFSIIAHDLKSPYNAQLGFLELLLDEGSSYTEQQRKRFINTVYHSTKQSFALLDNLLIWSRTQTGKIPFNPEELLLAQVFEEAIDLQQYPAQSKNILIETELCNDNLEVSADVEMVNTILRNLLSNAIKFTPDNGNILIGGKTANDNQILIYVKDTGIGIEKENLKEIFNPASNFSTVGTNKEKGTGIGLIICRDFVERNGGKIWVESEPGKGSAFYFTLQSFQATKKCDANCIQNFEKVNQKIMDNKELNQYFLKTIIPFFRHTYQKFSDTEIRCFIDELQSLAKKHEIREFTAFTEMIVKSLENNDNNQINICFAEFERLTDELEIIATRDS